MDLDGLSLGVLIRRVAGRRFWLRTLPNLFHDLRRGPWLGGSGDSRARVKGQHRTQSTDYADLSVLLSREEIRVRPGDVAVDVGCGRGRVLNWWLDHGVTSPIVGLELDAEIAEQTRRRLARNRNVSVLAGDAADRLPPEGTLFFLSNPFDERMMARFEESLSRLQSPADLVRIVYYNPHFVDVFLETGRWTVTPIPVVLPYPAVLIRPHPSPGHSARP